MTIQTLKHQYEILQKINTTDQIDQFLCTEELTENKTLYFDIFKVKQRNLIAKLILIFTEQMSNVAFEDFYECFSKDGALYLVFVHNEAVSLRQKLQREVCNLQERMQMGKFRQIAKARSRRLCPRIETEQTHRTLRWTYQPENHLYCGGLS